ncbi:MAG: YigZ family protein [Cyclobacteriaceae bacterium]
MDDAYLTLEGESSGIYKEKGSKFISFAYPVKNEEAIQQKLKELKKAYPSASHHCYAYVLGKLKEIYRANDDGEPHHSAGDPILGQIRSFGLTQVLIVVVRYFGGTKLGVGGLIQAYKTAAYEAILANNIISQIIAIELSISFEYRAMDEVMRLINHFGLKIIDQKFDDQCFIRLQVRENLSAIVRTQISVIDSVEIIT